MARAIARGGFPSGSAGKQGMRRAEARAILYRRVAVIVILAVFLLPLLWLLSTAYKPTRDIFATPPTLLFSPTWSNFTSVFRYFDLPELLWSSIVISLGSTVLSLLLGVPAGYALARAKFRGAVGVAYFFLAIRTVPPVATLIPFYILMRDIGLLGTWWAVILINTSLNCAFVVWMMYAYFRSSPISIEEAALTDGCNDWRTFLTVALPAVVPGIIASAIFCVMFSWNDFLFAMFLTRAETKPISVALLSAYGTKDISWGTLGALAHFSTLPIILMMLFLNRYFVQGLTKGVN
jgi:ABC-type glycerol-3-phosphate transport system permease component